MEQDEFQTITDRLAHDTESIHIVSISDDEINRLTPEQAEQLVALYGASTLVRLPEREQAFFNWLKVNDEPIWNDLWGSDDDPYLVGLGYLPELLPKRRGFVICDLIEHQNFYFSEASIAGDAGKPFLDAALDVVRRNGQLTMAQAFVVEAWRGPIDQWRFAYNYNLPLDQTRKMVLWLLEEGILLLPWSADQEEPEEADHDQEDL